MGSRPVTRFDAGGKVSSNLRLPIVDCRSAEENLVCLPAGDALGVLISRRRRLLDEGDEKALQVEKVALRGFPDRDFGGRQPAEVHLREVSQGEREEGTPLPSLRAEQLAAMKTHTRKNRGESLDSMTADGLRRMNNDRR
jgi:hypothetical protein